FIFISYPRPPCSPLFPYTTLFRSVVGSRRTNGGALWPRQRTESRLAISSPDTSTAETRCLTMGCCRWLDFGWRATPLASRNWARSEEHTSELQSRGHLVCRLLLEK